MTVLLDGKAVAEKIREEIQLSVAEFKNGPVPCLAVVIVGNHPPSLLYIERKTKACAQVGIDSICIALPADVTENALIAEIEALGCNPKVHGILIQLPLPPHINAMNVIARIPAQKDVDGLHPLNVGKMLLGEQDTFLPCTPYGIKVLLERYNIPVLGKHALIIGRSNLVGKPMAAILMQNTPGANATVTIAHSHTPNLKKLCLEADLIIAAMGRPKFVQADMIKEGSIVIDVGINKIAATTKLGYKIVGDVDFEHVKEKCSFITPVPGGVGPMTIAMLLSNTLKSFMNRPLA